MADVKISALPAVPAASGTDELMVNQGLASKKVTLNQIATFRNSSPAFTGTPTTPNASRYDNTTQIASTAFVQTSGLVRTKSLSSDAATHSTTAMVLVSGMDIDVAAGTYTFEYYIRAQVAATTQTLKFAVNRTGSTSLFCYNLFFPSNGVLAAVGVVDQELNATTGQVWAYQATRVVNTTLGPNTDVDTLDADLLYKISGIVTFTADGILHLFHGCEVNGTNATIKAGTSLILTKVI